jgi:hypothetical protein
VDPGTSEEVIRRWTEPPDSSLRNTLVDRRYYGMGIFVLGADPPPLYVAWQEALGQTESLDWDEVDTLLEDILAPDAQSPGHDSLVYADSRARRLGRFIQAVVGPELYNHDDTVSHFDWGSTSFGRWVVPGSDRWPALVEERARGLRFLHDQLVLFADGASGLLSAPQLNAFGEAAAYASFSGFVSCSPSTFLLAWFLRRAGIPCRELGGATAPANHNGELAPPDNTGHRLIEAWDDELDEWFLIDSTREYMGYNLLRNNRMRIALFRGESGLTAPLAFEYRGLNCSLVYPTPEGTDNVTVFPSHGPSVADWHHMAGGGFYRSEAVSLRERWDRLTGYVDSRFAFFGTDDTVLLRSDISDFVTEARNTVQFLGYCSLAMLGSFPSLPVPPEPTAPDVSAYVSTLLALSCPGVVVDTDFWFTSRYLLPARAGAECSPELEEVMGNWAWHPIVGHAHFHWLHDGSLSEFLGPSDLALRFSTIPDINIADVFQLVEVRNKLEDLADYPALVFPGIAHSARYDPLSVFDCTRIGVG